MVNRNKMEQQKSPAVTENGLIARPQHIKVSQRMTVVRKFLYFRNSAAIKTQRLNEKRAIKCNGILLGMIHETVLFTAIKLVNKSK